MINTSPRTTWAVACYDVDGNFVAGADHFSSQERADSYAQFVAFVAPNVHRAEVLNPTLAYCYAA